MAAKISAKISGGSIMKQRCGGENAWLAALMNGVAAKHRKIMAWLAAKTA